MTARRPVLRVLVPLALALPMLAALAVGHQEDETRDAPVRPPHWTPTPVVVPGVEVGPRGPVRFIAWGDGGTGDELQRRSVEAAVEVCAQKGCDFAIHLGDNIYEVGVESPHDPQFETKFERPYVNWTLPVYLVLGNHDVAIGDSGTLDNGDHQVSYARRDDRVSDKWRMPNRTYAFEHGDALFVALDLTPHARASAPFVSDAQLAWVEQTLDASGARWHVAFSHFPYVSNGRHGDAGTYDGREGRGAAAKQFLDRAVCGRVDLYLAAHDHVLEWLEPVASCPGTELVVSGAMAEPRELAANRHAARFSVGGVGGFFWIELDGDKLRGEAYSADGALLFAHEVARARGQALSLDQPRG